MKFERWEEPIDYKKFKIKDNIKEFWVFYDPHYGFHIINIHA
jgi:hypothetical protein